MNVRYPGQYFDAETGLHYNDQRYYDPSIGRYITSDPIGLDAGLNTYGYAYQNPVRYTDPNGLEVAIPLPSAGAGAGALGAAGVVGAGYLGWQVGSAIYPYIAEPLGDLIDNVCSSDSEKEKNCRALYDTIIRSCWSISNPRKRQRCFEAAKSTYEACMSE